jgi:hypothetical protein
MVLPSTLATVPVVPPPPGNAPPAKLPRLGKPDVLAAEPLLLLVVLPTAGALPDVPAAAAARRLAKPTAVAPLDETWSFSTRTPT